MSGSGFLFPPPPPPPPQASPSYPAYPTNPKQNGYGGRENRRGRDSSGRGAGNSRRGPRGNHTGSGGSFSRPEGNSSTRNDGYSSQTTYNAAGSYPLPEYPSVQQPQYIPNAHQGYGHTPSPYPAAPAPSYPIQPTYPTHQHRPPPFYDGAPQSTSYGYPPPTQTTSYPPQQRQDHRVMDRNRGNSSGQPVLMGPPIRLGFDSGYPLDTHRSPILAQSYPHLAEDRARPFYNDSREAHRQPYRQGSPGNSRSARNSPPNLFQGQRNRGQKRGHSDAFSGSRKNNSNSQVAPAVPSFGIPLPTKPPAPQEPGRKRKKKRRHNQLGLTPKADEHESSEEEDDVDEETKLAAAVGPSSEEQQLQFTYKGRTATLQSSAEIAAFIEERKKRFPTKKRIEQATKLKRKKQEAQRAADQARKKALEKQKAEFREKQSAEAREAKEKQKMQVEMEAAETKSNNAVAKAKSKVEKLRRQLEKQEKRIAKAEAKACKAITNNDKDERSSLQNYVDTEGKTAGNDASPNGMTVDIASQVELGVISLRKTEEAFSFNEEDTPKIKVEVDEMSKTTTKSDVIDEKIIETRTSIPDPLTPTSQPSLPDKDLLQTNIQQSSMPVEFSALANSHRNSLIDGCISKTGEKVEESTLPVSATTSDDSDLSLSTDSDSEDSTSSSGSSSENDAPETVSSTRVAPNRVPPPKRSKQQAICRDFLKSGRCRRGDACPFRHELPQRGSQATNRKKDGKKAEVKTERKGLYQRLVDQEKEKEDMNVLAAIVHLGEKGMLQEEVPVENDTTVKDSGASVGDEGVEAVTVDQFHIPSINNQVFFTVDLQRLNSINPIHHDLNCSDKGLETGSIEDTMSPSINSSIETPPRASSPVHNFGTLAVHAGSPHDPSTGAVIEAISLSTTFAQTGVGKPIGAYEYTRSSNPNRDNFERAVAALEHARFALAFSSGSAATATILQSLAQGSHVVSVSDVYGGTHRYFTKVAAAHGVQVTFSPSIEVDIAELIRPDETKLIWIESPSNPTLSLVDIRNVATIAHQHGIMVVVDNTFLSPYVQNPLDHGADIVIHSVTKYINGHSDVLMGAAAFNSPTINDRLTFLQNAIGAVPSPFDCFLAHRGLKTLHLRAREASLNASIVASALASSTHVIAVNYPGLSSHPQRSIAMKQHRDGMGGGMLSFRIKGGPEAAERFCQATTIFTLAESLGGVESLVEVPSSMTHAGIPREQREAAGVWDNLVRVSCGIEDGQDLKKDVLQALEKAVVGPKISNGVMGNGHS